MEYIYIYIYIYIYMLYIMFKNLFHIGRRAKYGAGVIQQTAAAKASDGIVIDICLQGQHC